MSLSLFFVVVLYACLQCLICCQDYVKEYDRFMYLIDGRAEVEIEAYVKEAHTFEEFSKKVKFFDDLGKELTDSLPKEINLGKCVVAYYTQTRMVFFLFTCHFCRHV